MQANIVSAVSQALNPELIARMALASGVPDHGKVQTALTAAVPAILSGLANVASKPDGARRLAETIANQSPRAADLSSMAGDPAQLADTGKSLLSSLLGPSSFGALAGAIGKYTGLGDGAIRSLLGMVAPLVVGVLGRESGTGSNALTQLLSSQRDNIAAAMPPGLSDALRAGDRIGTVSAAMARPSDTSRARETTGSATRAPAPTASASSSSWAYWALPILALAGLAWYFWGGEQSGQPVSESPARPTFAPQSSSRQPLVDTDLQPQITAAIDLLNRRLQEARDRPSAPDVLQMLQQAAGDFDRLNNHASRLPFDARDRLAENIKAAVAQAKTALDNTNAAPGLAADTRPVIAGLRAKLDALALTPLSVAQQRTAALGDRAYLARSPADAVSVSAYFDRHVYNGAGDRIGTISDLVVGPDARIAAAVIGVGGFLGIGEKEIAVPFASMQLVRRDNDWHLVIEGTREALSNAPTYEDTTGRVRLTPSLNADRK
jgi:sporulation protein YlmC with PRC-barrel domain